MSDWTYSMILEVPVCLIGHTYSTCIYIEEVAVEVQGIEEAAQIPIYTQQPGMRADIGTGQLIDFLNCSFQQPCYSTMLPLPTCYHYQHVH